jgi:hypothetical protein
VLRELKKKGIVGTNRSRSEETPTVGGKPWLHVKPNDWQLEKISNYGVNICGGDAFA